MNGITQDSDPLTTTIDVHGIPEAIFVGILEYQLPRVAPIHSLVQPRKVAFPAGHHDRRVRIEGLNAAEVELLRARRYGARLPNIAAVLGPQHRAIRAR